MFNVSNSFNWVIINCTVNITFRLHSRKFVDLSASASVCACVSKRKRKMDKVCLLQRCIVNRANHICPCDKAYDCHICPAIWWPNLGNLLHTKWVMQIRPLDNGTNVKKNWPQSPLLVSISSTFYVQLLRL